jgi:putative Mg2+ transporter-C (MgtC) family protein
MFTIELLTRYWTYQEIIANLIAFANIFGALLLGLLLGYERSYSGRAAGMRTFGLVCMASCALVVLAGSPALWYGGISNEIMANQLVTDPTRIIQGITMGIGFLCAGVIVKDGLNISGLTTSAALWASSAVGILVGIGFYATAILLTCLSAGLMIWASKLENWLPSKQSIFIMLRFKTGYTPQEAALRRTANDRGYEILTGSLHIEFVNDREEWKYIAVARDKNKCVTLSELAEELRRFEGVQEFNISYSRN